MKKIHISIAVLVLLMVAAGLAAFDVTVGAGDEQNRKPFDFYYRFSLFETLYYPDEITTSGTIEAITFYNNFPNSSYSNGHVQIWLGTTDLNDLSTGWIPSTELISVYNHFLDFPNGQNAITLELSTPFLYTGRNLVMMARTPGNDTWGVYPLNFFCQTIGTNRARDYFSNTVNGTHDDPPMTGVGLTLSGQFPKTTFHFSDTLPEIDLGITSFTGPDEMYIGTAYTHTVTISNYSDAAQSDYTVKLFDWNNNELASVAGTPLASGASADIAINWIPDTEEGYTEIYAQVFLTGDENYFNDISDTMEVCFLPEDNGDITPPNPITAHAPIDFSYKNSLFETIFPPSFLQEQNFYGNRLISMLKFKNSFAETLPGKPIKIWLGQTQQTNLTAGWIPSSQLTLVFDGTVDFPSGINSVNVVLQNQYFYTGGNLVMMVNRPMDTSYYDADNLFTCYSGEPGISRNVADNTTVFDPANPPAGTANLTNVYPHTIFTCTYTSLGTLKGCVYNSLQQPLNHAEIHLDPFNIVGYTETDGTFNFSWLLPGTYQLTVNSAGYLAQTRSVDIIAGHSSICNFGLHSATDLIITGRVICPDNPTPGIANASVELVGAVVTSVATDAEGYFTIYDVIANQNYELRASYPGYLSFYGNIAMQTQNLELGNLEIFQDITVPNEDQVTAVVSGLTACYPNPFNSIAKIRYEIKEPAMTTIEIYNVRGQKVATLSNGLVKSGSYTATWNGRDGQGNSVASGIYYCKMKSGSYSSIRKMVLMK